MPFNDGHDAELTKIGFIPVVVFLFLIGLVFLFDPLRINTFNPPNLLSILNTVFITGTGIVIAWVSAKSYLKNRQLSVLLLGSAVLAGGLASLIGGWLANISPNYGVTTHNVGMFASSTLQVLSALVTMQYLKIDTPLKGKAALATAYSAITVFMALLTATTLLDITPVFFTSNGPTLIRQFVLGIDILFFISSSLIFFYLYLQSKSKVLYWYSLALGLFAIGMLDIVFQMRNADSFAWIGRLAQYAGGFYFIIALLSIRKVEQQGVGFSPKWADTFRFDRKQFFDLFENMLNGFTFNKIIVDKDNNPVDYVFLDINAAFEKMTGLSKSRVMGKRVTDVISGAEKEDWIAVYGRVAIEGMPIVFESYSKQLNKWFNISAYSPEKGYFTALFEDFTERKKAEEQLEEYRKNLEKLVEERTKQLKDAERLATIGQTAGMVGHDIRNPLQAIISDVYLLDNYLTDMPESKTKADVKESLDSIEKNIGYINKIVADLQDYTRKLKPNIEHVNVKDLINSTLIVTDIPENVKTQVNFEENFVLKSDATYLRRVLTNLVVNAVQAMPNGGKLTFEAYTKENKAIISVKDSGMGIPEVKPNLFKPLFTTKSKGQGLGLAVVKRLVEALNGKVSFKSKEGKGTEFIIELPLE